MNFREAQGISAIRAQAREFAAEHVTEAVREHEYRTGDGVNLDIHRAMGRRGWILSRFPEQEGGAGLTAGEADALLFELTAAGVPTVGPKATPMAAAAIRAWGGAELKAKVLPEIARGESLVCLGYTEPGSGSDVAAAKTRAVRDGDEWIINGQKVFTTFAHLARYCFLLTRTDPQQPKHRGLTMFLAPLESPGIEIQPVHTLGGERTNVVYYTDVRIPDSHRLGEVNEGWRVLRVAIEEEHTGGLVPESLVVTAAIEKWAQTETPDGTTPLDDPAVRTTLAQVRIRNEVAALMGALQSNRLDSGIPLGLIGPMAALYGTESYLRNAQQALDLCGPAGVLQRGESGAIDNGTIEHLYRAAVASTIYGGTSEVMREQIAARALGLPRLKD
ncbi:acyl-CoA dehydrogenase family protein [Mycolicibacterium sp. XJ1819]